MARTAPSREDHSRPRVRPGISGVLDSDVQQTRIKTAAIS
jgi:hypothetical protein